MKLVIFGTGKYYTNRMQELEWLMRNDEIVAYIDNKTSEEECFREKRLLNPSKIVDLAYDKIILMSTYKAEMVRQLLTLGVNEKNIFTWNEYRCEKMKGQIHLYINDVSRRGKRILLVSTALNWNGGSFAAVYAAEALLSLGYDVWLAVPHADDRMLSETCEKDINIAICYDMPYIGEKDLYWILGFDIVMVNVFQMIECAYQISLVRPVLWWIHEPIYDYDHYKETLEEFSVYRSSELLRDIYTVAVSEGPKRNFNSYFPNVIKNIMPYGIPDEREYEYDENKKEKFVFAIIGNVGRRKAQKLFIEAALKILECQYDNIEFWIIGAYGNDDYSKTIKKMVADVSQIKLCGLMNREEIKSALKRIDVIVCASMEDPLPIVVTEGMMYGKIIITTDVTGQADMIRNGENGFITKAGDSVDLFRVMERVLLNKNELAEMKRKSRDTYEQYFTMDKFGERLERELLRAEEMFEKRREGEI